MVTTVFRKEKKQPIDWTQAEATKKIDEKRKNILHIWVTGDGSVFINDRNIPEGDIAATVRPMSPIDTG